MTEIPEDIMKAAKGVARVALRNLDYDDHTLEVGVIAQAILAERERCASKMNALFQELTTKAMLLRGEQAYREFPKFVVNRLKDAIRKGGDAS